MSEQTNEETPQSVVSPEPQSSVPWENVLAQVEAQSAINAKSLTSNLIASAQMLLRKMQTEKDVGLSDKTHSASIERMLELAAKADVLGDRAIVRYEKAIAQVEQSNEKLPVTKQ